MCRYEIEVSRESDLNGKHIEKYIKTENADGNTYIELETLDELKYILPHLDDIKIIDKELRNNVVTLLKNLVDRFDPDSSLNSISPGAFLKYRHSLFGFQGGNESSDLWICGLEYQEGLEANIINSLKGADEATGLKEEYCLREDESERQFENEPFNNAILKLTLGYKNYMSESLEDLDSVKRKFFTKDGYVFKMNLFGFPERVSSVSGTKAEYVKKSLDSSKEEGFDKNRFLKLRNLLSRQKESKKIICCSRTWPLTYLYAFSEIFDGGKPFRWKTVREGDCIEDIVIGPKKYCDVFIVELNNVKHYILNVPFLSRGVSAQSIENIANITATIDSNLSNEDNLKKLEELREKL